MSSVLWILRYMIFFFEFFKNLRYAVATFHSMHGRIKCSGESEHFMRQCGVWSEELRLIMLDI